MLSSRLLPFSTLRLTAGPTNIFIYVSVYVRQCRERFGHVLSRNSFPVQVLPVVLVYRYVRQCIERFF